MLKMVMMVHRTEEMWLSRNQDASVRDGTLNYLINTAELPRSKFSCCFLDLAQGKCVFRDKLRLQNYQQFELLSHNCFVRPCHYIVT